MSETFIPTTLEDVKDRFPSERKTVAIEDVFPNSWNPNVQSPEMFAKAVQSIQHFGFIDPVLVRRVKTSDNEDVSLDVYEIIDGEHRWRAAKKLGYTQILVEDFGERSVDDAKALTLIMNHIKGNDDVVKRAEMLGQMQKGHLGLLPFTGKQITQELELLNFDPTQYKATDVEPEDVAEARKIMGAALTLGKLLHGLHAKTNSTQLKLLCENYGLWFKTFRETFDGK